MTHNKFTKAKKNFPFEIAGADFTERYSKIRSLYLLVLFVVCSSQGKGTLFINNIKSQLPCEASPKNSLLNKVSSIQPVFTDQPYVLAT